MSLEFALLSAFTRRLPPIRGAGMLANAMARFYCRRPRPEVGVVNDGIEFEVMVSESVNQTALAFFPRLLDRHEHQFLRRNLRPGATFVDIGAHVGSFTLPAARRVGPTGHVVAVEASPPTFDRLARNIALNGFDQVRAFNLGVSDKAEMLRLGRKAGNSGGNSFLRIKKDSVEVECRPLLTILQDTGVAEVAMLKIDVEGFEVRVLSRFFSDAPLSIWPKHMIMEMGQKFADEGDCIALAVSNGYEVVGSWGINYVLTHPDVAESVVAPQGENPPA